MVGRRCIEAAPDYCSAYCGSLLLLITGIGQSVESRAADEYEPNDLD